MGKLLTQLGAIMTISMSISGLYGLTMRVQAENQCFTRSSSLLEFELQFWFRYVLIRSADCFSLGWPMRDDGDFFKSTRERGKVVLHPKILSTLIPLFFFFWRGWPFSEIYFYVREGREINKNLGAQENQILSKHEHFGTFFEVLIDCGLSIYWLCRFSIVAVEILNIDKIFLCFFSCVHNRYCFSYSFAIGNAHCCMDRRFTD